MKAHPSSQEVINHGRCVAAGLLALIWLIPFLGVFMASIRPLSEISRGWWKFEQFNPTFRNYAGAWNHPAAPLGKGMLNSLRVAVPATILPLAIASIAAYGFARFRFRLRDASWPLWRL